MENILITGVAGFIGSNLANYLIKLNKYNIIGIDNLSYGIKSQVPKEIDFYNLDIRGKKIYSLFNNIDYVFHFAAKNCLLDCQLDPIETMDINVLGSCNVFEASKLANVKKVIYAESSALYEGSTNFPTAENEVCPQSFYAISKVNSMNIAKGYATFYKSNFTALRYFCVYGPRQDYRRTMPPIFSSFIIKLIREEQPIIFGSGEKRRDFIHVDDINAFHLQCITDNRTDNKVYNLGSGKNYSINEIYTIISSLLGKTIPPKYKDDLPGEAIITLADINEAMKIGWVPSINLEEGLKTSIEYIKGELDKGNIK